MPRIFGTEIIKSSLKLEHCPKCNSDQFSNGFCGSCYEITGIYRSNFGGARSKEAMELILEYKK